jgi:hypothetical protein
MNDYRIELTDPETGEVLYVQQVYWNKTKNVAVFTNKKEDAYVWNHGKVPYVVAAELRWDFKKKIDFIVTKAKAGPEDRP